MANEEMKITPHEKAGKLTKKLSENYDRSSFLKKMGTGVFAGLVLPAILDNKFLKAAQTVSDNSNKVDLPKLPNPTDAGNDGTSLALAGIQFNTVKDVSITPNIEIFTHQGNLDNDVIPRVTFFWKF